MNKIDYFFGKDENSLIELSKKVKSESELIKEFGEKQGINCFLDILGSSFVGSAIITSPITILAVLFGLMDSSSSMKTIFLCCLGMVLFLTIPLSGVLSVQTLMFKNQKK